MADCNGGPRAGTGFARRLARYCARNPVALERLTNDRAAKEVTYRSDKSEGPTAGTETADPLELLARVLTHIPDSGQVTRRYNGWYANRPRGMQGRDADPRVHHPDLSRISDSCAGHLAQVATRWGKAHGGLASAGPRPATTHESVVTGSRIDRHKSMKSPAAVRLTGEQPTGATPPLRSLDCALRAKANFPSAPGASSICEWALTVPIALPSKVYKSMSMPA